MSRYYSNSQIALGDLISDKPKAIRVQLEPRCTSEPCCRYKTPTGKFAFHHFVVVEEAKKSAIDCPRCGHVMYWHNPALDDLDEIIDGDVG